MTVPSKPVAMLSDVAEGRISWHAWGESSRSIVVLHAAATDPRAYAPLARLLAAAGWRVLVPALAGYGASRIDGERLAANIAIARHVMTEARRDTDDIVLFGHSMGGLVALEAAAVGPAIDRLILYEPIAFSCLDPGTEAEAGALLWDRQIAENALALIDHGDAETGVRRFIGAWNEMSWEAISPELRAALVAARDVLASDMRAVMAHITAGRTPLPSAATLVLRGTRSPQAIELIARKLGALLPRAKVQTLDGLGHMGPLLGAEVVARAVLAFASR